jgi:hypothetical protein
MHKILPYHSVTELDHSTLAPALVSLGYMAERDELPITWTCEACDNPFTLSDLGVGEGTITGFPVCPGGECAGHGFTVVHPA